MIAGNHDSPARLEFFSGLARRTGVHGVGRVGSSVRPVELTGADGTTVRFWPLAYTDPETARYELAVTTSIPTRRCSPRNSRPSPGKQVAQLATWLSGTRSCRVAASVSRKDR